MEGHSPWTEEFDVKSSDSETEINIPDLSAETKVELPVNTRLSPRDALLKRAEAYQEYMKKLPVPAKRGSVIPFGSWMELGRSLKELYGQPLHYLTNIILKQWDRDRFGSEDEYIPLDDVIHPVKAEATVWLMEEVHRKTSSPHAVAKHWLSDPMHNAFIDSIYYQS